MSTSSSPPAETSQVKAQAPQAPSFLEEARRLVASRFSLVYVPTFEDQRVFQILAELGKKGFQTPMPVFSWSVTEGLKDQAGKRVPESQDPIRALDHAIANPNPALYLFKDLNREFGRSPYLLRKLRDAYQALKANYKTIFLTSPQVDIPDELSKEFSVLDFPLPNALELEKLLVQTIQSFKNLKSELTPDDHEDFVKSALGLTWDEARMAFTRACTGRHVLKPDAVSVVIDEKSKIVQKDGILEYVSVNFAMQEIGGLENLKDWLEERARFFTKDAKNFGISAPKGVLLTGIAGCGKSSCVKAISQYWRLPLMRLDMTKVYGGTVGNPEETMRRALQTVEAVAPCILWIEEIEKGVAGFTQGDGGVTARIFSSFLTWMQEKTALVFVAATANQIDLLPPELMRKGRFDEIFFTDLPTENERADIFKVHILKHRHKPDRFDLVQLAKATVNFNGAEIEQVVASGMFAAFNEKRHFNTQDLFVEISKTVPLATTMSEAIKKIKRWADTRAVRASKG